MRARVLTVSDRSAAGLREDATGPKVVDALRELGFATDDASIVSDDESSIVSQLVAWADDEVELIVTNGGTGIGPRDRTPEATTKVLDTVIPGLAELMRLRSLESTPMASLSRAVVGVRGETFIVNVPGSTKGAVECLGAIAEVLPHALSQLRGGDH